MNDPATYNDTCDSIRSRIWYELRRHGLTIPFPIRTLDLPWRRKRSPDFPDEQAIQALRQQPLMALLSDDQFTRLLDGAARISFGSKEEIIEQGADGDSMFVIAEGRANVFVEIDGSSRQVATFQPGDFFGEISMLTGEPRSATVRAETDCEVLEINKELFSPILLENPGIMEKISRILAGRKMEVEGVLASAATERELNEKQHVYASNFLTRLRRFFNWPGGSPT
jgi:CRP-like cAMP-binding protein